MTTHPLFKISPRTLGEFTAFPEDSSYQLYVFQLEPAGYLVLHSDDSLPLVLAYSTDSSLSLEDVPENAFRAFLVEAAAEAEEELAQSETAITPTIQVFSLEAESTVTYPEDDFVVGPLLESTWNQNDPYNYYAPIDSSSDNVEGSYYDGRMPIGCVPLAYAQLLYYHRWPMQGYGSSSYTDDIGDSTGTYSAVYSDDYDWDNITKTHSSSDSDLVQQAIGELVYELAVAAEADFESESTGASIYTMSNKLVDHFQFENSDYYSSYETLQDQLDQDILDGYPGIISIPSHAVVADGLLRIDDDLEYHINYGWGGTNNGWFAYDSIPGGGMMSGIVSLRPKHLAYPEQSSYSINEGEDCDVLWTLPKRRNAEVDHLRILKRTTYTDTWSDSAENFDNGENDGWSITSSGYNGSAWYAGPSGTAQLDLIPVFIPYADSVFQFQMKYRLGSNEFRVLFSTDGGETYSEIQSWSDNSELSWEAVSLSLADYAGQEVYIRLELVSGSYYSDGGIWVDELSVTSGSYQTWENFIENPTQELLEFSSTSTLWEDADAFDNMTSTSTSDVSDWELSTETDIGEVFYKAAGGYSNREYHLTSTQTIYVANAQTRLSMYMKTYLASDEFQVLASTDGENFTSIGSVVGSNDWGDYSFDLSDYVGDSIYIRLEYLTGSYYSTGGVWIDSISVEEVTNAEYESQAMHLTSLSGLAAGDYVLAAQVVRFDESTTPIGESFTLTVNESQTTSQGIPYPWLIEQGLVAADASDAEMEAAALSDISGKGQTAAFDYIAGTDPNDATDRLEFSKLSLEASETTLEWNGAIGRWYQILHSTNLETDSWNILTTVKCLSSGETLSTSFTPSESTNFFKISVSLEEPE